jgi:signal transduction histidine kinase/CheY-like chemotaxis protein
MLTLHELPLVAVIGIVTYVSAQEFARAVRVRDDPLHRWSTAFALVVVVLLSARLVQRTSLDPVVANWAIRIQIAAGCAVPLLGVAATRSIAGIALHKRIVSSGLAATLLLMSCVLFTELVVGGVPFLRSDALGNSYWELGIRPTALLLVFVVAITALDIVRSLRVAPRKRVERYNVWRLFAVVAAFTAVNDLALAAGVLHSVQLFEYGVLFFALGSSYILIRRTVELQANLEREVDRRTAEIRGLQERVARVDRLASLGTLAAGAAHEINNPLAYMTINLDLAQRALKAYGDGAELDAEDLRELLSDTAVGAKRVARVVEDLRSLSRNEEAQREPVDVEASVRAALQMTDHQLRHKARIHVVVEHNAHVIADETRLTRVFVNLLVNAAQAIDEGHVDDNEIRIGLRREVDRLLVEVSDSGSGIDEEVLPRIFDPFFTTKPVGQGTGLGLAIVHEIVQSFGGDVNVESTPDQGTKVGIELPIAPNEIVDEHIRASLPSVRTQRARVLVADDEALVRRAVARTLGDHDVVTVSSGREALDKIDAEHFDVVVCDLMMPDVSGMEVFEQVLQRHPDLVDRFLVLTGGVYTQRAQEFLSDNSLPCITKPFSSHALQQAVDTLLDRSTTS